VAGIGQCSCRARDENAEIACPESLHDRHAGKEKHRHKEHPATTTGEAGQQASGDRGEKLQDQHVKTCCPEFMRQR
jgi:hypothetical protein